MSRFGRNLLEKFGSLVFHDSWGFLIFDAIFGILITIAVVIAILKLERPLQ